MMPVQKDLSFRKRSRSSDDEDDYDDYDDESNVDSDQLYQDGERSGSETDVISSPSSGSKKKQEVNSNALKTKQWREKQKLLHEKRKDDLTTVQDENTRLRRENEELRKKMMLLEGSGPMVPSAAAALPAALADLVSSVDVFCFGVGLNQTPFSSHNLPGYVVVC
jgi:hypothetical protein